MGLGSIWHWLVLLAIVLILFGPKRLKTLGSDLGTAIKGEAAGRQGRRGGTGDERTHHRR